MDDFEAIQRLKDGDISGLETLVTRHQTKAMRAAFLITHDETLAEDVVQDTFVRIYHRIHYFDSSRPFEPYLLRSVVNAALNVAQGADPHLSMEGDPEQVESLLSQAASIESEVEYIQLKQQILTALAKLEPRQRAAVVQRYFLEMSEREMADALKIAPGTVKWLLNTARARLREMFGSERYTE